MGPTLRFRAQKALLVVACVAPFVWLLILVVRLGVSTPFSDEWNLVPLLQKQSHGVLGIADVWAQHNEHRQFFPELILLKLAALTRWNIHLEMVVNVLLAAATLGLLIWMLKETLGTYGLGTLAFAALVFSWMAFSPRQWENWQWGWEICWFLTALGIVGAVAILSRWPEGRPAYLGAALAAMPAILASYSLSPGLAVWIAGIVIFLLRKSLRRGLAVWLPLAAVTVALFFYDYHLPPSEVAYAVRHPISFAEYFFAFIGSPLAGRDAPSILIGMAICATLAVSTYYLARKHLDVLRTSSAWVALAVFGLLQTLITDLGRLHFGLIQSQGSRYTTLSLLLAFSALALGLIAARCYQYARRVPVRSVRVATAALVVGAFVVTAVSYNQSLWRMWYRHNLLAAGAACMRSATGPGDPCLLRLYPDTSVEWQQLQYLRAARLTGLK